MVAGEGGSNLLFVQYFFVQDFLIAGGLNGPNILSSVLTLFPGARAWTPIASLPRLLYYAQASIVGGRIRVIGGQGGFGYSSIRSEVMIEK